MKILYLGWHEILEADELKIFSELGHSWLSLGKYYDPNRKLAKDDKRPVFTDHKHNLWDQYKGDWRDRNNLTPEQIRDFDVLIFMHEPTSTQPQITSNWENLKHKKIIYRSIGQSISVTERALAPFKAQGLKIIRYSPQEETIPGYCGADAMIRFYKDENEFKGWNGRKKRVITIGQNFSGRMGAMNFHAFRKATEPFDRRVYGPKNESIGIPGGELSFENLKKELRENRVYFFCGTQPASYTLNFIEAWMTGIPVVALGPDFMTDYPDQQTYEVHKLIENGVDGFWSNDIKELREYISMLLRNQPLAKDIGERGRQSAIKHFGKSHIKKCWKEFLEGVTK